MASIWYLWTQRAGSRGGEASDPGQLSGRHAPAGAEDTSLARGVTAHGRRGAQMTRSARNSRPGSWRNLSRLRIEAFAHTIAHGGFVPLWGVPQVEIPVRALAARLGRTIRFRRMMRRVKRQNKSLSLDTTPSLSGTLLPSGCLTTSKPARSAPGASTTPSQSPTDI